MSTQLLGFHLFGYLNVSPSVNGTGAVKLTDSLKESDIDSLLDISLAT